MNLVRSINDIAFNKKSVVTIGTFDGVHLAHQKIIKEVIDNAKFKNCRSVAITFDPHPREVIKGKSNDIKLLTTLEEREHLFEKFGIDLFLAINFDMAFSRNEFRGFYEKYLVKGIGLNTVVEGYDHHWGKDREGNIKLLKDIGIELGFEVVTVEPVLIDGVVVSSSMIRKELLDGNVEKAARFLGRHYSVKGTVVEGDKRGQKLGYATANLEIDSEKKLIPKNGIYFTKVFLKEKEYFGMTSIGLRPTFKTDGKRTVEVNIFDFNKNIYGDVIGIKFIKRLRDELRFDSAEELVKQMQEDEKTSRLLKSHYLKNSDMSIN